MIIADSCIIWFYLDCIMQLKWSYYIATCSQKVATTFGDLPDCIINAFYTLRPEQNGRHFCRHYQLHLVYGKCAHNILFEIQRKFACQYWFRQWFGALRQQAIIWLNVDPEIWRYMEYGHRELNGISGDNSQRAMFFATLPNMNTPHAGSTWRPALLYAVNVS